MDADDADLVRRIAAGDRRAMRLFYEKYQQAVFAFALSRCGDAALASDCVHDAMLDVWRTASRFAGRASVKTWIFSIARNKLVDIQRKRGRLSFVETPPDSADPAPDPEAAAMAAADRAPPAPVPGGAVGPAAHRRAPRLSRRPDLS
jgi:RNA polymerase sigma-70 factor (ECF subfamily)